jgi:hypothetical protein
MAEDNEQDPYGVAAALASNGKEDVAYAKFAELLNKNFDDAKALYGLGRIYREGEHYGLAFNLFRICAGFKMGPGPWNEMGLCQAETYDVDLAINCFKNAMQMDPKDPHALGNLAMAYLLKCEPEKALHFAERSLKLDPSLEAVRHHQAYAHLLLRNWKEGWEGHRRILGKVKTRTERFYENKGRMLPSWDGAPGQSVLVYGEQGIGDEISFASCIPDLQRVSKEVVFDCDHRLETLFRRSFPEIAVYGTRFKDPTSWIDDHDLDARVAIGDLPAFFRNRDEDFPGTPYLKATPGRWARELTRLGKPVIGIAWTGGLPNTGSKLRSLTLNDLEPVLRLPFTWVSLEYKDRTEEIEAFREKTGIQIHSWEWEKDYDDTASLVSQLDLVISATTAVVHLAGALGKECWCIAPKAPRWFYGLEGDLPWYKSVKLWRQERDWPIRDIARVLSLRC